ncbi:MAG: helix-turn-helix transcriptional regulator [Burkholderiaceae bacterium]|jgi:transcriptional regulator with XRE-family HTH domain
MQTSEKTTSKIAQPKAGASKVGELLRHWRDVRGKSQFDLSLISGISQRHISFIESGRSVPSREVLTYIAQSLDVPLRDRNALLLASGYAPIYSEAGWDAVEMESVAAALRRMLKQHEPFPAVVMDRHWNVLMANDYAPRLFGNFVDLDSRGSPRNLLELLFDPNGLRPFVVDWETAAKSLLQRVHREAVGQVIDGETEALLEKLLAYPGVELDWLGGEGAAQYGATLPVIPLSLKKDGILLRYFSLVTTVGTPQTVTAQEMRLECMFPVDKESEKNHLKFIGAVRGGKNSTSRRSDYLPRN